jgi:hypothetical protein
MLSRSRSGCNPSPPADDQRQPHHGVEHPRIERFVERGADSPEYAAPDHVEHALGHVQAGGNDDQADQRWHAAARQHPVIDLQHEDRAGQIEQIDDATHQPNADEGAAANPQRITEFGTPDTGRGCHLANLFQMEGENPINPGIPMTYTTANIPVLSGTVQ